MTASPSASALLKSANHLRQLGDDLRQTAELLVVIGDYLDKAFLYVDESADSEADFFRGIHQRLDAQEQRLELLQQSASVLDFIVGRHGRSVDATGGERR